MINFSVLLYQSSLWLQNVNKFLLLLLLTIQGKDKDCYAAFHRPPTSLVVQVERMVRYVSLFVCVTGR